MIFYSFKWLRPKDNIGVKFGNHVEFYSSTQTVHLSIKKMTQNNHCSNLEVTISYIKIDTEKTTFNSTENVEPKQ